MRKWVCFVCVAVLCALGQENLDNTRKQVPKHYATKSLPNKSTKNNARKKLAQKTQSINSPQSFENLKSISAEFVQYTKGEGIYYSGFFEALVPFYARWEYEQPLKKIVYLRDKALISYEPLLAQAVYMQIGQSIDFLKILHNAKQSVDDPMLYLARIEGKMYRLYIQSGIPKRLEYEDALGNEVMIVLKNVQLNPPLLKKNFDFSPPQGVDILKQ